MNIDHLLQRVVFRHQVLILFVSQHFSIQSVVSPIELVEEVIDVLTRLIFLSELLEDLLESRSRSLITNFEDDLEADVL